MLISSLTVSKLPISSLLVSLVTDNVTCLKFVLQLIYKDNIATYNIQYVRDIYFI